MTRGVDVTGLQPEARETVHQASRIVVARLGDTPVSLVAHGSAVTSGVSALTIPTARTPRPPRWTPAAPPGADPAGAPARPAAAREPGRCLS